VTKTVASFMFQIVHSLASAVVQTCPPNSYDETWSPNVIISRGAGG
jgi:hypothetical protein